MRILILLLFPIVLMGQIHPNDTIPLSMTSPDTVKAYRIWVDSVDPGEWHMYPATSRRYPPDGTPPYADSIRLFHLTGQVDSSIWQIDTPPPKRPISGNIQIKFIATNGEQTPEGYVVHPAQGERHTYLYWNGQWWEDEHWGDALLCLQTYSGPNLDAAWVTKFPAMSNTRFRKLSVLLECDSLQVYWDPGNIHLKMHDNYRERTRIDFTWLKRYVLKAVLQSRSKQ